MPKVPEVISEAGIEGVLTPAAVIKPLPLTVKLGIELVPPNDPTLPFTVARVVATAPVPDPVTSPVSEVIVP